MPAVFDILRNYNIGFCIFDLPEVSCPLVATTDFIYVRLHGSQSLYSSCYSSMELSKWAHKIVNLAGDHKAIYVYFNNDVEGFAVKNALDLKKYLGIY